MPGFQNNRLGLSQVGRVQDALTFQKKYELNGILLAIYILHRYITFQEILSNQIFICLVGNAIIRLTTV